MGRFFTLGALVSVFLLSLAAQAAPGTSLSEVFERASPAVGLVTVFDGAGEVLSKGSGFIVNEANVLVTNYHVMEGGNSATVEFPDGATYRIRRAYAVSCAADLALLEVGTTSTLPHLELTEALDIAVGDRVVAIGNPLGGVSGLTQTSLSEGVVSGLRVSEGVGLIQTTAAVSEGSSGGPLLSEEGIVEGVVTFAFKGGQGLNYAVRAHEILSLADSVELKDFGSYSSSCQGSGGEASDDQPTPEGEVTSVDAVVGTYRGRWASGAYSVGGELIARVDVQDGALTLEAVFTGSPYLSREVLSGPVSSMGQGTWSAEVRARKAKLSAVLIFSDGVLRGDYRFRRGIAVRDAGKWVASQ